MWQLPTISSLTEPRTLGPNSWNFKIRTQPLNLILRASKNRTTPRSIRMGLKPRFRPLLQTESSKRRRISWIKWLQSNSWLLCWVQSQVRPRTKEGWGIWRWVRSQIWPIIKWQRSRASWRWRGTWRTKSSIALLQTDRATLLSWAPGGKGS